MLGRRLTDAQIVSLVGAQPDDRVTMRSTGRDLELILNGHTYHANRVITGAPGDVTIGNESFTVYPGEQGQGVGTRVFATQAHAASALGVRSIQTYASRGLGYNGYYTWPRLGYNAPFYAGDWIKSEDQAASLPGVVMRAHDFHDLMSTAAGREWWRDNGDGVELTFDTRPGSKSLQILDAYLQERGIEVP